MQPAGCVPAEYPVPVRRRCRRLHLRRRQDRPPPLRPPRLRRLPRLRQRPRLPPLPQPQHPATPSPTPAPDSYLANISTRMRVEAGDNVLIAGFIVEGSGEQASSSFAASALRLVHFGVADALQDPMLEIARRYRSRGVERQLAGQRQRRRRFDRHRSRSDEPKESALLVTLPPGSLHGRLARD